MQYYFLAIKSKFWLFAIIFVALIGLILLPAAFADDSTVSSNSHFSYADIISSESTLSNGNYASTSANELALLVDTNANVTLNNPILTKSGSNTNSSSLLGNNSGLVAAGSGALAINGGQITTNASNSNAIHLCTGIYIACTENSTATPRSLSLENARITTSGAQSVGIFTIDTSDITIKDSIIETSGNTESSAIYKNPTVLQTSTTSTLNIDGGTYTTNGTNSPVISANETDATIANATIVGAKSAALHIKAGSTFTLNNTTITANNTSTDDDKAVVNLISGGHHPVTPAVATINGGTITAESGSVFCANGNGSVLNLNNVTINTSTTGTLIRCQTGGSEETLVVNASHQTMSGEIAIPTSGIYTINLTDSSNFTGAIKNASAENTVGNVTMDSSSTWTLTDHTTIDSLTDADTGYCNINFNGYELRVGSSITPSLITQSSTCNESPSPDPAPTPINVTASVLSHDDAPAGGSIGDFTSTAVAGETIMVNFIPAEGYAVANVYVNSINVTSQLRGNTLYLTAGDSDLSIVVEFQKTQFTVNVIGSHIGVVPSGATAVVASGELTVYIGDPDHGYYLDSVTVNGADQTASVADGKLKLDNITADLTVIIVAKRITYQPLDGNNQVFIIGQNAGKLRFSFDVDYSKFETGGQVYIDNVLLGEQHYTSMSGSTIIDVDSSVFDDLEPGEHTLSAPVNDGGIATAKFTVLSSAGATTPDTGEFTAGIAGAIVSFTALPLLVFGGYYLIRWRKQNKPVNYY